MFTDSSAVISACSVLQGIAAATCAARRRSPAGNPSRSKRRLQRMGTVSAGSGLPG
ncbi:hypothetical protein KCP73_09570 [Salmonella enterica subsp. enterica]|nr:hypothetical protein KCP73_09570 [Salmonella enterica subsp. enterica]